MVERFRIGIPQGQMTSHPDVSSAAPQWLHLFPFIETQWQHVQSLAEQFPSIENFDLNADWHAFIQQNQHLDDFAKLRQFRKSRLAFLAYWDLNQPLTQHIKTMAVVSELADHLIKKAYEVVHSDMLKRFGVVKNTDGEPVEMLVFALGKLGTLELNYSSDVDLVFVYGEGGSSDGNKSLDAKSYFTRFGQKLIKLLDVYTTDGLVYRVDMRLRPFGSAGPLVCSINALTQYLVNEGRDWERFAWMRARLICGQEVDAEEVMSEVEAFIYRKHLDYKVFDSLAKIKNNIALEHQVHPYDLKLGVGGIRTIEFIVQSLQVVFGGRNQQLRGVSIYPQFALLLQANKINEADHQILQQAWLWLRKLENMAQIVNDQSTHELPEKSAVQAVFAELCDRPNWQALIDKLNQMRHEVDNIFTQIFNQPETAEQLSADQQQFAQNLVDGLNLQRVPQDTAHKARQLLELTISKAPVRVSEDFTELIKVLLKRPNYLLMLLKEQNVHNNVLQLLSVDKYFKGLLLQYPVLFEQLFEYQPFMELNVSHLSEQWQSLIGEEPDTEQWMEQLRYFKLLNHFNLKRFYYANEISQQQLRMQFTELAEFILKQVIEFSFNEVQQKLGKIALEVIDLMVIAYGSMGVKNMKSSSDLDLVFVLDKPSITAEERVFLHRWIKRIMHHLNSQMYHGLLYEIDLQLRPNGHSGPLITTREEFVSYQKNEAWTWEHAAMVKSRLVFGTQTQKKWHQKFRSQILSQVRDPEKVDKDLLEMAKKLQQVNKHKAHESDFDLLGGVLKHAHQYPELTQIDDLNTLRKQMSNLGLLP